MSHHLLQLRGLFHPLMFTLYLFTSHLSLASYKREIGMTNNHFYLIIRVRHYMSLFKIQK